MLFYFFPLKICLGINIQLVKYKGRFGRESVFLRKFHLQHNDRRIYFLHKPWLLLPLKIMLVNPKDKNVRCRGAEQNGGEMLIFRLLANRELKQRYFSPWTFCSYMKINILTFRETLEIPITGYTWLWQSIHTACVSVI